MQYFKIIFLISAFICGANAFGHAVVTHSSLKIKPVPYNQASQVELSFNSKVELDLSEVFLVRSGDKMETIAASPGKNPGQVILDLPALSEGEYAIKLKVFAADGHLSEDLLRFFIRKPNQ